MSISELDTGSALHGRLYALVGDNMILGIICFLIILRFWALSLAGCLMYMEFYPYL